MISGTQRTDRAAEYFPFDDDKDNNHVSSLFSLNSVSFLRSSSTCFSSAVIGFTPMASFCVSQRLPPSHRFKSEEATRPSPLSPLKSETASDA